MHIACPNCSTSYEVPDSVFAGRARKLRCENCGHKWMAGPQEESGEWTLAEAPMLPEAVQPQAEDMPRQFGLPADEQAKAEFERAIRREAGSTDAEPAQGGAPGNSSLNSYNTAGDDMDRFISLVHAARSKAIEFEPEPPPRRLSLTSPVVMGVIAGGLIVLLACVVFFLKG